MAEDERRHSPEGSGYPVHPEVLRLDLFRLLTIFNASQSTASLTAGTLHHPFRFLTATFERSEASRILLTTAIHVRNLWDFRERYVAPDPDRDAESVGVLRAGAHEKAEPISFREACIRLVQSRFVNFEMDGGDDGGSLLPRIHVYGDGDPAEWKATIAILPFIEAACRVL
jgi:hypothetical protein